ncbi:MAG: biotin--[acetyl-CoA-carboxylase] ligase [Oscillospiraceae bacterium]|nr:biotin--[acetyl-CoA-carboxylase] ligase [Oscillospiraceae bacterium]
MDMPVILESVDSTNTYLKELAVSGAPSGTAVVALEQTAGRGMYRRSFESPKGAGLYLSYLLRPDCPSYLCADVTPMVAVAVCRAIEAFSGLSPRIKWINDIISGKKKLGGILTETAFKGGKADYIITGIGINLLSGALPQELSDKATCIEEETGKQFSPEEISPFFINELNALLSGFPNNKKEYIADYRQLCITPGNEIFCKRGDESFRAFAEEIDEDFGLVIRLPNGKRDILRYGEASVRGMYGYT